jgi:HTH-type transcriptional regulator / antitoxin HigA
MRKASERYLQLIARFPLRPIRSEKQLDDAIAALDVLLDQDEWSDDEKDYRDVLGTLIHEYESEHIAMDPVSDSEMLRFLLEAKEVTQAQAAKECRIAESTISAILSGQGKPNRNHIAKFAAYFHVAPTVFSFDL